MDLLTICVVLLIAIITYLVTVNKVYEVEVVQKDELYESSSLKLVKYKTEHKKLSGTVIVKTELLLRKKCKRRIYPTKEYYEYLETIAKITIKKSKYKQS